MKIVIGERGSRKSTELIRRAAKDNLYILVATKFRSDYLFKKAREMGLTIPYPVTINEYMKTGAFKGSNIYRDGLLIDDADDVLKCIFRDIPIHEITITAYDGNTEYLDGGKLLALFGFIHSPSFEFECWDIGEESEE